MLCTLFNNGKILNILRLLARMEMCRAYFFIIQSSLSFPGINCLVSFLYIGAETLSDTSSVSVEITTDSRETSVATSILSPFTPSRGRDEVDNRSEHSYSESGASGSSFEELDMEGSGEGDGMAGLSADHGSAEDQDTLKAKWTKEPIALEKERGEE